MTLAAGSGIGVKALSGDVDSLFVTAPVLGVKTLENKPRRQENEVMERIKNIEEVAAIIVNTAIKVH